MTKKELTYREVEVLKALKRLGFTHIAKDSNGGLFRYYGEPTKGKYAWLCVDGSVELDKSLFNFIKWEDEKPTSIQELLSDFDR